MLVKVGRSSGLSAQHFSINSKTSDGHSLCPTNGRNGGFSCNSTRSNIPLESKKVRAVSYGPPRTTISSKMIANEYTSPFWVAGVPGIIFNWIGLYF